MNRDQKITTFFMFNGKAEEAMTFYSSIFEASEIMNMMHHEDGTVLHATFMLKGQTFMAIDNVNRDEHPFSPAMSLFVACDSEEEIDRVYDKLSVEGTVLMPLEESPFSEKFAWVEDRFGVCWQLNLSKMEEDI
ncbi:VOC family protein [Rossellomorea aquimaris]|jgi:predicted 3-demethylubiquinone-9 3-methyltransferase (glyoxalase superfamily)|uniref:VOC family protein n=1 Tax=Rossellomorea aquimaris TaxID=189382 RepID=UPI0024940087|nr:VOC family protein [Rossellomorea aquimaris]